MTEDYKLPPVKRQALIRKGLGHWLSVIDLLLQRFVGIEEIIERREEDGPMAVMMRIINDVCAVKDNQAAEAHLRFRLAHLPLFHFRATRVSHGNRLRRRSKHLNSVERRRHSGKIQVLIRMRVRSNPGCPTHRNVLSFERVDTDTHA